MHEGPVMKMGDGFWAPQDVRWLADTLRAMPDTNQPVIFVTHYPIDDGIANWYEVLDLLKQYNAQAVLCGHGHANHRLMFEGIPGTMGRSNLRASAKIGGFNLVEVNDGRMIFSERITGQQTKEPWHSVVLERHDFAGDTNRYPRPDFSVNGRYPKVEAQWTFNTGYLIASTPAVAKHVVVIGDASGTVYGLALKNGKVLWRFKTKGPVYSTPAVADGLAVFGSTDGNIYAITADRGQEVWRVQTERPVVASPVVSNGRVFIGSSEREFRALKLADGKPAWEFGGLGGFVETRPLVYQNKVIFGAWDQNLYAIDVQTGELAWSWKGDHPGVLYSPAACWPVAADGKIFLVAPDRQMTAISAATGKQLWRTGEYKVRESIGLGRNPEYVYVRAMNDFFYAFSARNHQKVWEQNAHFGYDINSAMLVEKGGVVFYGTKNGLLFALDSRTGAIPWEHKIGVGLLNTVVPLSRNRVLSTDFGGDVTLIREF
jgi:outer membrane protein assembly factor BamB